MVSVVYDQGSQCFYKISLHVCNLGGAIRGTKISSSCLQGAACLMEETDRKATVTTQRRSAMAEVCRGCVAAHRTDRKFLWSDGWVLARFQEKVVHEFHLKE